MRDRLSLLISAALFAVCPARAADVFLAGIELVRLDVATGEVSAPAPLGAPAADLEIDPAGRYVAVATARGLRLHHPETLALLGESTLGTLDAVELVAGGDSLAVLLHPARQGGLHRVYTYAAGADGLGDPIDAGPVPGRSYDLVASPDGRHAVVTDNLSRLVHHVDRWAASSEPVEIQVDGDEENQLAVLRAARFTDDGKALWIGESARTRKAILWKIDAATAAMSKTVLPWRIHVLAIVPLPDGSLLLNGLDQMARVDAATGAPLGRYDVYRNVTDLGLAADGEVYGLAAAGDGTKVLRLGTDGFGEIATVPIRLTQIGAAPPRPGTGS